MTQHTMEVRPSVAGKLSTFLQLSVGDRGAGVAGVSRHRCRPMAETTLFLVTGLVTAIAGLPVHDPRAALVAARRGRPPAELAAAACGRGGHLREGGRRCRTRASVAWRCVVLAGRRRPRHRRPRRRARSSIAARRSTTRPGKWTRPPGAARDDHPRRAAAASGSASCGSTSAAQPGDERQTIVFFESPGRGEGHRVPRPTPTRARPAEQWLYLPELQARPADHRRAAARRASSART